MVDESHFQPIKIQFYGLSISDRMYCNGFFLVLDIRTHENSTNSYWLFCITNFPFSLSDGTRDPLLQEWAVCQAE